MCPLLADAGHRYCDKHGNTKQGITAADRAQNASDYKIYNTTWRKLRWIKLKRNPLCELCLIKGEIVQAQDVHHMLSVDNYPELRLDIDNLQSLCKQCHSTITREENKK